ncbi:hypothetical protein [Thermosphaera sp.]
MTAGRLPEYPAPGEPIPASWGRAVVDALRARTVIAGPGVLADYSPNGTKLTIDQRPPRPVEQEYIENGCVELARRGAEWHMRVRRHAILWWDLRAVGMTWAPVFSDDQYRILSAPDDGIRCYFAWFERQDYRRYLIGAGIGHAMGGTVSESVIAATNLSNYKKYIIPLAAISSESKVWRIQNSPAYVREEPPPGTCALRLLSDGILYGNDGWELVSDSYGKLLMLDDGPPIWVEDGNKQLPTFPVYLMRKR